MTGLTTLAITGALALSASVAFAGDAAFDTELSAIQSEWAVVTYETPKNNQVRAVEALNARAEQFAKQHPDRAEALIWQGIVLSSYAGIKGGLGALGLAKKSRSALEKALTIDPHALDGSAYTSLGTLYYKVPGFPLGFGDDDKAREYLQRALAINPDGIDPNYFYGDFLLDQGEFSAALQRLEKARRASPRPGRELADAGRRKEIEAAIARLQSKR
jgi:tetratricopeptide (TPR) repeat protein